MWHLFLFVVFLYSIQHLVRDVLQDILGVHNAFTEFAHFEADASKVPSIIRFLYTQPLARFLTFPIEIFMIVVIPIAWRRRKFTRLDWFVIALLVFTLFAYSINVLFDSGI